MMFRNASWSVIASAYRLGLSLLATLLAVRMLGVANYGNVAVLVSIFAVCNSLGSGVFVALVAKGVLSKHDKGIDKRDVLSAAASFLAAASVLLIFVFAGLIGYFADYLSGFGVLNDMFWSLVRTDSLAFAALTSFQIYTLFNAAMLESAGRLDLAVKSQMLGPAVVLFGLIIFWGLATEIDISTYVALLCCGAASDMLMVLAVRRVLIPGRFSSARWRDSVRSIPDLLKSGSALQFSAVMNILLEPLNKLLLTQFVGSGSVAAYDLAMKVIWGVQGLFIAAMRVFLHLDSQKEEAIVSMYVRVLSLLAVPAVCAHIFGALLLSLFAHYAGGLDKRELMIFFGVATVSNLSMIYVNPLYITLIAYEDRGFLFRNQVRLTLANLVASSSLIPTIGLTGAALGLCLAALYNTGAIYERFKQEIAPIHGFRNIFDMTLWRYCTATALLLALLMLGAQDTPNCLALLSVCIAVLILMLREPLIIELRNRLNARVV